MDGSLYQQPPTTHPLWNTNRRAWVDSVLMANKHMDWVKRLYEQNAPSIQVQGERYRSTHLMSDNGKGYVFPHVVRQNGKLVHLKTDDEAEEYARKHGEGIQMTPEQASWFSTNGYKTGTNVLNKINSSGTPFNDPKYNINH